ncbi:MAG: PD-(D/E)XK nuclease family protein, partial [Prevotellaceae bacterium]|nr:PD-(D/E)XK nuclease family protein [Prevotellaceae bacterium]
MKTFIEHVAEDLLSKFGNNLSDVTVIFPNKRASLFLNEALATYSERPVLAPKYYTISELFCDASDAIVGDRIELVFLLYKVYQEVTKSDETLDRFFPWGEIIINDFDDIDKHMLDADKIFTNVKDIHEFDDIEFLSDEQKEVLKHFFPNYEGNNTHLKEKFLKLWSKLAEIYTAFQEAMRQSGIMYEGALYRYATDKIAQTIAAGNEIKHYVFVGFNHLLPVENQLFKTIKNNIDTLFYWDYDNFYINNHEAGNDIKQNLILFPNALGGNEEIYDNFSKPKDIQVLTSSTDNLQARYVYNWVQENNRAASGRKSVIVLADESLLPTVIHSLPKEVDKVNITIGYNLSFTDIPLIINHLMSDRKYKTAKTLSDKLSYLATAIHEKAQRPFPDPSLAGQGANYSSPYKGEAGRGSEALRTESLFRTYTLINRLKNLIDKNAPDITEVTMQRLLNQLISTTSVPFHGEPLEGLQIMGVLETRNLDFDNVLMLSCNEGIMPKASDATSFIPYFLRKAYGLTTIDNKVSTYSYYFYRLLQRCNNATLLWNKSTEGMHRGEMSRFILQLMVESSHQIKRLALSTGQTASTNQPVAIEKTDEILQAMKQRFLNLEPGTLNL